MGVNYPRTAASLLVLLTLLAGTAAHADGVGAGTLIENTATATYDAGDGQVTVPSNTVTLRVDELLDVAVTSLNSGPVAATSGTAALTFEVTNTGNGPEAFVLTANPAVAGNDFDTTVDTIAVDSNGNGVYDPGVDEVLTGPATTRILDADENLTVFVIVSVPGDVLDGEASDIDLLAEAVTGTGAPGTVFAGRGVDGGDAIAGAGGADDNAIGSILIGITSVELIKSASVSDPFGGSSAVPGSVVTYTITAAVSGSGSVADLVVTDTFPSGTTYGAGSLALDAAGLTDASDADAGEATASGISVNLGTVAGGTSHSVTFNVTID
ncbi:DUF11 domain-containing protein [Qipengyuania aurantiaca]|uniref:DUF11 domain-containing protein n=1 Tax=Qipengyuania aurantiaca TaxID=2867233 RepID=A0ABX8ZN03_9SPHN|nr:DUF11 domain-containing protein [Qipengyuania aurantiaca]